MNQPKSDFLSTPDKKSKNLFLNSKLMTQLNHQAKNSFLYPCSRYYGQVTPENLIFNANLQEFAQKVGYISSLETNGKLSPEEAWREINALWQTFKASK